MSFFICACDQGEAIRLKKNRREGFILTPLAASIWPSWRLQFPCSTSCCNPAPHAASALIYSHCLQHLVLHCHLRRQLSHKVDTLDFVAAPCAASALIYSHCLQQHVLHLNPRRQLSKLGHIHSLFAALHVASKSEASSLKIRPHPLPVCITSCCIYHGN